MQQSLSSGDVDIAGLEDMLDDPINRPRTPAAIAAAYDRRIKDKAMEGLLEEREGIDGFIDWIRGLYFSVCRDWAIIIVYTGVSACIFYYVSIATATPLCTPFYYNPLPIIILTPNLSSVRLRLQLMVALPYLLLVPLYFNLIALHTFSNL